MRMYIANPIAGVPDNYDIARTYAGLVEGLGGEAVVPQDIPPHEHLGHPCPEGYAVSVEGHSSACHLRTDLQVLLTCDGVLMADGWRASVGCKFEWETARMVGIPIYWFDEEGILRRGHGTQRFEVSSLS